MRQNNYYKFVSGLGSPSEYEKLNSELSKDSVKWTVQTRILNGRPFSFDEREYLHDAYRSKYYITLIRKGRQTEMTEMLANLMFHNAWKYPGTTGAYVSNSQPKAYRFSKRRIRDILLKYSPKIQKICPEKNFQITEVTLANGSIIYFLSAQDDFKEVRSVSADFLYVDELQSINLSEKANLTEAMSHSQYKQLWGVGTGSIYGSDWKNWFESGTDSTWSQSKKKWIHKNQNTEILSIHIPQTIVPWITQRDIDYKKATMPHADFVREVMGGWVKGDEIPITEEMVEKLFIPNLSFTPPKKIDRSLGPVVVSADWGGSTKSWTIIAAYQILDLDIPVFRLLNMEPILYPDIDAQSARAIQFTQQYSPDITNIDIGGGEGQVQSMEKTLGTTNIWKTRYLGRTDIPIHLDQFHKEGIIKIDRTYSLTNSFSIIQNHHVADGVRHPRLILPGNERDALNFLFEHFTSLYAVETSGRAENRGVKYERLTDKKSDAMHNFNYANIARLILLERMKKSDFRVSVGKFGSQL